MNVTTLEQAMIKKIARSEFTAINGGVPSSVQDIGWVWGDMVIEDSEDKGVFSSLVKKGLANHSGNKGRDACVTLTEEGFKVFKSF